MRCDLARTVDIEAMVAKTVATFGPIQILVNNAGVFEYRSLPQITEEHFHTIFNTNVLGLLMTTKIAVAHFDPGGGSVVKISSLAALGNGTGRAVYTASKAAVNAIMPGYFDTEKGPGHSACRAPRPKHNCSPPLPLRSGLATHQILVRLHSSWPHRLRPG